MSRVSLAGSNPLGGLGAAHAVLETIRRGAILVTADRAATEPELPDGWTILDVAKD
jgi:hypothetical protein